jgi:3-deoxy-D-manno-octulosonate 8-phosphate phosphatase (KDO 8-P phosphatase)
MSKRPAFKRVKIFLCDVDGVLTDAGVFVGARTEFKRFNVQDGMGLRMLQACGIPVGWVSNRASPATTKRARELKVDYLWQKPTSKVDGVASILRKAKLDWTDACFMSDDMNDLAVLHQVGLPIAVANAVAEVKKVAHYSTRARGGDGAVREICDKVLSAQCKLNTIVARLKRPEEFDVR